MALGGSVTCAVMWSDSRDMGYSCEYLECGTRKEIEICLIKTVRRSLLVCFFRGFCLSSDLR